MKVASLLILVAACMSANAFVAPRFAVVEHVLEFIERFKTFAQDLGLDPLNWEDEERQYSLPVPTLFTVIGTAKEVKGHGLTDIDIIAISYDDASSTFNIRFKLDHIHLSGGQAQADFRFFDRRILAQLTGSLDIRDIFVDATVVFDGLVAKSAVVISRLGGLESDIGLVIDGQETYDLSERLNYFINTRIPRGIDNYQDELDEMFAIYLVRFLNWRHGIEA